MLCFDCNQLYAISSNNSSQRASVLKSTNTSVRRPPYPSEVNLLLF